MRGRRIERHFQVKKELSNRGYPKSLGGKRRGHGAVCFISHHHAGFLFASKDLPGTSVPESIHDPKIASLWSRKNHLHAASFQNGLVYQSSRLPSAVAFCMLADGLTPDVGLQPQREGRETSVFPVFPVLNTEA